MDKILAPIKHRIIQYVENKRITKEKFYSETGLSPSNFKGKAVESEIGGDKIAKILSIYTDINLEWLILGQGNMLRSESTAAHLDQRDEFYKEIIRERDFTIKEKDATIMELSQQVGRLEERVAHFQEGSHRERDDTVGLPAFDAAYPGGFIEESGPALSGLHTQQETGRDADLK